MDNIRFGSFVAQLRKERGLTQKELAQRLHVTDKAVSKWETGRGFPDLKLLEPLAQNPGGLSGGAAPGERGPLPPTLSVEEAGQVAARAMDQYQQTTVPALSPAVPVGLHRAAVFCFLFLPVPGLRRLPALLSLGDRAPDGGSSAARRSPTVIITSSAPCSPAWFRPALLAPPVRRLRRTGFPAPLPGEEAEMKRLFPLLLTLLLFPLPGCGLGNGIPAVWTGRPSPSLTRREARCSPPPQAGKGKDVPRLSLSVQVEADSVVLTRPETGERWSGTLAPGEAPLRRHYRLPPVLPRRRGRLGGVWYHRAHRWQPGGRPLSHCRGCDGLLYRPTF